jgi:hypothetical protein
MFQSTLAVFTARGILACSPEHERPSAPNLSARFALIATLSVGCQLDVGGIHDDAAGPGVGGASSTDTRATSASGTCMATGAEVCSDGVDNDCNGSVDCADPACRTGFVCAPPVPSGWKSVAFSPTSKVNCPNGYMTVDVVSVTSTSVTCSCNCALTAQPSCTQGTISVATNNMALCPNGTPLPPLEAKGGECTPWPFITSKNDQVKIDLLPVSQGSCSSKVAVSMAPTSLGRACIASEIGAGCTGGGACVAIPQAPLASCIVHDGAQTCPSGYPKHYDVGTRVQSIPTCSSCSCSATATCSSPKLTLYTDTLCSAGALELPVTGVCAPVNDKGGNQYASYQYKATMSNPGCQKKQDTAPTGSLKLAEERTVCCP